MADRHSKKRKLTPMLEQYLSIKRKYPDAFLLYRMGDFYELFFEDAERAAPILEVQLTSRDKNAEHPIPMCGVPHHAASNYIHKLVSAGHKVALCEQLEEPTQAKGVVKRDVVRVITPSLIGDPDLVEEESENILACLYELENGHIEVCFLNLLSGEIRQGTTSSERILRDLFAQASPKECLVPETLGQRRWFLELRSFFSKAVITYRTLYFRTPSTRDSPSVTYTAVLRYLEETQKMKHLSHLKPLSSLFTGGRLYLDHTTITTLEVTKTIGGDVDGPTLFNTLNQTSTPMGRRALKAWLVRPLTEIAPIQNRLDAVENLVKDTKLQTRLVGELKEIRDLERLTTKTALGLAMPRDLVTIRDTLGRIQKLKSTLKAASARLLKQNAGNLKPLTRLYETLMEALEDTAPATIRDGHIFRSSFHPEISEYRQLAHHAKQTIAQMELQEREKTKIPTLKIKYNKVFGYTIEVTKAHVQRVPKHYIRKQTIANGERYITEPLKDFEHKVITAEHKLKQLEETLFYDLRKQTAEHSQSLLLNAQLIAEIDVLCGFASIARQKAYCKPLIQKGWELHIKEGRHPVVESLLPPGKFVPNHTHFAEDVCQTLIITGPNMAGKSTIMRQVALLSLMAHAGCFLPAKKASIPVMDAIFTRIGSSDDLAHGKSTFMVEMSEVSRILKQATARSLIVIDEIGRGTSTYDGLSLAWSLIEYIHHQVGAKTLFATHFHELTALEKTTPQLKNANVLVDKWKDQIVFLHKLAPGACSRSYGIEVANLANLPETVIERARQILGHLEAQSQRQNRARNNALIQPANQLSFFENHPN